MRIIAGKWRGRPLKSPPGEATRPTADRVREALFSMLTSRLGDFDGLRVADLYAGTGALGLEALSRGGAHVAFVENERVALDVLKTNIATFGADRDAAVLALPVEAIGRAAVPYDVVLLDPPYGEGKALPALVRLQAQGWIAPHTLVSVETGKAEQLAAPGFDVDVTRVFGKARITLLRPALL
jgi:16S rRNA (guanine966-N2)-methyltransferase